MTRLRRQVIPGWVHHFTQRGNNRQAVFYSDNERLVYLALVAEYFPLHGLTLVGYELEITNCDFKLRRRPSRRILCFYRTECGDLNLHLCKSKTL